MAKDRRSSSPAGSRSGYRVEKVSLSDLHPPPRNPRRHRTDALRAKLRRFGYVRPVVALAGRPLRVVAGNGVVGALLAMQEAGEAPPAGVEGWMLDVRVVDLPEREATAYLVADNQDTGSWEPEGLLELLAELAEGDALDATGFALSDVEAMVRADVERLEPEPVEDVDERQAQRTITLVFDAVTYTEVVSAFARAMERTRTLGYSDCVRALLAEVK